MPKSLLENAKLSICMGVDDYEDSRSGRHISAIRNLYAGVLLLLKEKLRKLSPDNEILIAEKIKPAFNNGKIVFVNATKNKKTINFHGMQDRFRDLEIKVDFKRLSRIKEMRNNLEHYYELLDKKIVSEAFYKAVMIINPFLRNELKLNPEEFFGKKYFSRIVKIVDQNLEERKQYCNLIRKITFLHQELKKILIDAFCCPNCTVENSFDIHGKNQDNFRLDCLACGHVIILDDEIDQIVKEYYWGYNDASFKDGGERINYECPDCLHETYLYEEDKCIFCGYERQYKECARCYGGIGVDEQDFSGMCGYCENLMTKDD